MAIGDRPAQTDWPQADAGDLRRRWYDLATRQRQLPGWHPSGSDYGRGPTGDAADIRPLTDAEHVQHVADIKSRLADARTLGRSTDRVWTIDPAREVWSETREGYQEAIIADLYAKAHSVPCEQKAILTGGLPGAGKTTVLASHADVDVSRYMVIDPDVIKAEMARRGLVPAVEGLSPLEACDLVHEESSHISKRLAHRAQAEGKNLIWDVTMAQFSSTARRLEALREAGYHKVEGVFVDISIEVSLSRTDNRHRAGHEEYRAGLGDGGRFIPSETIIRHADSEWGTSNRRTFEHVRDRFDAWIRYENLHDSRPPALVDGWSPPRFDQTGGGPEYRR